MEQLTIAQLRTAVAEWVATNKLAQTGSFEVTTDNIVGLSSKIALLFTIQNEYSDKLSELDGQRLPYGNAVEEWQIDLGLPEDYQRDDGSVNYKFFSPSFRPISYSYGLDRKKWSISIPNYDIETAVNSESQLVSILVKIQSVLQNSFTLFKYNAKRQLLGNAYKITADAINGATPWATGTALTEGTYYSGTDTASNEIVCVCVQSGTAGTTIDEDITAGRLVVLDMITNIDKPTDNTTGENFILQIKKDVEIASDVSEGYSLNGGTLGATSLKLYVTQGIMPYLDVYTMAGAFHLDKVAVPVAVEVIKDFGDQTTPFAMLVDSRGLKLFEQYYAVREDRHGVTDFITMTLHYKGMAHISRNAFMKFYVNA